MMLWSLAAGGAILWGTCLVVFCQEKIQEKTLAIMMALAAGVMMAAGVFDLLPSAAKIADWEKTVLGFVLGLGVMAALKEILRAAGNQQNNYQQVGVLVFAGIAFHDVLEGAAIGAGYSVAPSLGVSLALAVGLHHLPEGIAMAAPLKMAGMSGWRIVFFAAVTSLMTPLGVVIIGYFAGLPSEIMGAALAVAAGAMAYLSLAELLPEALAADGWREVGIFGASLLLMGIYFGGAV